MTFNSRTNPPLFIGLLIVLNLLQGSAKCQDIMTNTASKDSGAIYMELQSKGFFQNYEYFNKIKEGTTLPGVWLQPVISYRPIDGINIRAGIHLLNYSGRDTIAKTLPVLSVSMKLWQDVNVTLGSFYTLDRHRLEQPLLKEELLYTKPVENGVQLRVEKEKFWGDFWISWETFILPNDPFQERFLAGISILVPLFKVGDFAFQIPYQQTFSHRGGQNITIDTTLLTLFNSAAGITCNYRKIGLTAMGMIYKDLSPEKQQPFKQGSALYVKGFYKTDNILFNLGYWHGNKFMSPKGEELFLSAIPEVNSITYRTTEIVFGKLTLLKEIKGVGMLGFDAGFFQNLSLSGLDYYYGLTISIGQEFFLGKVKAGSLPTK